MIFATGGFMVLIDLVANLAPPETAIPFLAMVGMLFGIGVTKHIEGAVTGLVFGAVSGALGELIKDMITTQNISGVEGFLLTNMFLWVGLLLFAAGFSSQAAE
jgi:hypothetical protein